MGAVHGLALYRRVPPGVIQNDRISGGQVQACAACLEADQENLSVAGLEPVDLGWTIPRLAVQHRVGIGALNIV